MNTIEVVLCSMCKGEGVICNDELVDYHKRDYVTHVLECKICKGSGRLKRITTVTYEPHTNKTLGSF